MDSSLKLNNFHKSLTLDNIPLQRRGHKDQRSTHKGHKVKKKTQHVPNVTD